MLRTTSLIGFGSGFFLAGGYSFVQSSESEWSGTLSHYTFDGANIEGGATGGISNNGIRSDDTFEPTASWSGTLLNGNMINMGTNNAYWWQATSSTNLKVYSGGTLDGTVDMPDVGDVMRIKRAGEVWTLEYDNGGDGNFSVTQTFSGTNSSATFRLHVCIYTTGDVINSVQWGNAN